MAIQLLPGSDFGGDIGKALGTGLGSGLQQLAQLQLGEMKKRRQAGKLKQGGLPEVLAYLDPQVQASYLREYGAAQQQAQQQSQQEQEQGLLENILSGSPGGQQQQQAVPEESLINMLSSLVQQEQAPQQLQQPTEEGVVPQQEAAPTEEPKRTLSPGARAAKELEAFEAQLNNLPLTAIQKARMREQVEKRVDRFTAQQDKIDEKTKPYYEKLTTAKEGAKDGDLRLDRMEEMVKEGNLPSPLTELFLETMEKGIPIPGTTKNIGLNLRGILSSPDAQEFSKLSKDFLKDVKKFFGSNVTQQEVNQFLKTIPSLIQSDEGKLRVIRNMRLFNDAAKLKSSIAESIIEKNNGYRPHNLKQLVEKAAEPQLEKIAETFKDDIGSVKEALSEKKRRKDKKIEEFAKKHRPF